MQRQIFRIPFRILVVSWLILFPLSIVSAQSQLKYKKLTTEDGLSSNNAMEIFQDSYGFVWISTTNGLNRYDGYEIKTYLPILNDSTSISGSLTTSIYEDKDRNIWVGTWSSGLNLFERKTESFKRFVHNPNDSTSISSNSFVGTSLIFEDHAGNFWIGTDDGINLLDRSTSTFKRIPIGTELRGEIPTVGYLRERADERAANRIRVIYQDRQKNLWVGTDWGGLYRYNYESKSFTGYFPDPGNPKSIDHTTPGRFIEDNDGNLWIQNYWFGIIKMDVATGLFQRLPNDPHDPGSLSANAPLGGFFLDNNILWIGSSIGLYTYNIQQNTLQYVDPVHEDFEGYISVYLKDKQGNYWFSSSKGVLIVNTIQHGFQKYVHKEDEPNSISPNSLSIGVDSKGLVYVMHNSGIDVLDEKKRNVRNLPISYSSVSHNDDVLTCMLEDKAGNIFFGGKAVYHLSSDRQHLERTHKTHLYPTHGFMGDMCEDGEKNIWYGGYCLSVYNPITEIYDKYYPNGEGNFAANQIYSMLPVGPDQILLGGVWDGLILFDTKERKFVKRYLIGRQNNLQGASVEINKIYKSLDGKIWLGTNYGLSFFDKDKETYLHYGIQEGLPSNVVYNIVEDDHHDLWLSTSNGLSRFDPSTKFFRNFDYGDGLQGNEFFSIHSAFKHPVTRELWFIGTNGLTVFHPDSLRDNPYIPPVIFTKLIYYNRNKNGGQAITDNTVHNQDHVRFAHSDNIIEFHFAALNFVSSEKNKYAYRLTGFNDDWVQLGTRREVSFTNLNPGKYTLQVKASNNDGIWNEEGTSIEIQILPPWWRTWWAYLAYVLLTLGAIRTYVVFRSRNLQARNVILEKKVTERTDELRQSFEQLKSTQTQLIQSEKMASLGELTAGIAHEIQNPLNFVNNFSELNKELIDEMQEEITSDHKDEAIALSNTIRENQEKINFHGKRADSIVKSMLLHSRSSTGKKELTDINALADEYLRLAYHGMRAKDKSFNAEFKTDLDPSLPKVEVIAQDIGRVLLNLVNNAFQAVSAPRLSPPLPELDKLTQSSERDKDYSPTVSISTKRKRSPSGDLGVEIRVSDNGPGIPKEALDKIFQPFFTTKAAGQGTGLGLSISYDIIKAHAGELKVETHEGVGSTFIITLPIA